MKFIPKALIICILCFTSLYSYAQVTQVVAHRGYWDTPNNNQNSITALKCAQSIPVYGSEFDVNMTSDGVMIVSHGPKLETIADVQKASYKEVKKLRLKNGEKVPTLKEYLKQGKKGDIKLIFELKVHPAGEKENLAVKKSADMVKKMKLQDKVEFISFSLEACKQLAQLMPECRVQYLNGKIPPKELKEMGIMGLDYHYSQIQKNPQWIEEAHKLGMIVNVWTVNKPELIKEMIDLKVDFITTDAPELVLEMLK
ncbi:MAG: glycerophosphodiester phosphodiesterase [Bacteroidales bacterium]|nr:glycerophosphodiester phosphodiesterase [Bacteroidales bacterium]